MIPVELSLHNFMSYGEETPPLDFRPLQLACLSGPNGAGKSALLDAMTWALWGEARKPRGVGTARPETHLLRMGAAEMRVQLVFDLEGDRYRVARTYSRQTRTGRTGLELQVRDSQEDVYHPLTEPTLRGTQQKINELLRMDYPTFVNSAFLMQGRADEFSRRTPRERKEILAEILGLSYYDRLAERARERARGCRQQLDAAQATLEALSEQLKRRPPLRQELQQEERELQEREAGLQRQAAAIAGLQETVEQLQVQGQRLESLRDSHRHLLQALEAVRQQAETVRRQAEEVCAWVERGPDIEARLERYRNGRRRLQEMEQRADLQRQWEEEAQSLREVIAAEKQRLQSALESRRARLQDLEALLQEHAALLGQADAIRAGARRLEGVRRQLQEQQERRQQHDELEENARQLEHNLARRRAEWEGRRQTLQGELERWRAEANAETALRARLQDCEEQIGRLEEVARRREEAIQERERWRTHHASLRQTYDRLQGEDRAARERLALLQDAAEARCPLCRTELGPAGLEHVRQEYQQQLRHLGLQQEELRQEGRQLQQRVRDQDGRLREWERALTDLPDLQRQGAALRQQWQDAVQAREAIREGEERLARLERELEEGAYAPEVARRLAGLREKQAAVGYRSDRHRQLQEEEQRLRPFAAQEAQLEQAERVVAQRQEQAPILQQEMEALTERLDRQDYAHDESRRFEELRRQARELGYDREAHRRLQRSTEESAGVTLEHQRLQEQRERAPVLERQQAELAAQMEAQQRELDGLAAGMRALEEAVHGMPGARSALDAARAEQEQARRLQDELRERVARGRAQLEHLDALEGQRREQEEARRRARRQQDLAERLALAFGRDGIQAWLIERAIPEIEDSANELLQRLTFGQAQVAIEPLRDLKTGGVRESLDIYISDEAGTRPYEMFSGGEAFRIDFALRIALSRLLVGRAGARLQTLVIDEGFGTQDREGLALLVEAIQQVARDFDKILVVTHLEELKDAFPVRVEVHKSPQRGSWYEVVM